MKKAFAAILLLVYFTVSTGFTVNLHYCMNEFQSWDLSSAEQEACSLCGMKDKAAADCCHDEVKVVKLQQDLSGSHSFVYNFSFPVVDKHSLSSPVLLPFSKEGYFSALQKGPPLIVRQDIYLLNRVFRL